MSVYVRNRTYGCYQMKIDLPKRFLNKDKEYKEWKKKKDEEFDKEIVKKVNDKWWKNLSKEEKDKYPSKRHAVNRKQRMSCNFGGSCKSFKTIKTTDIN